MDLRPLPMSERHWLELSDERRARMRRARTFTLRPSCRREHGSALDWLSSLLTCSPLHWSFLASSQPLAGRENGELPTNELALLAAQLSDQGLAGPTFHRVSRLRCTLPREAHHEGDVAHIAHSIAQMVPRATVSARTVSAMFGGRAVDSEPIHLAA